MLRARFWPARKQSGEADQSTNHPAFRRIPSQRSLARRALTETTSAHRWMHRGVAALAVAVLGVGTAGSIVLTGNAERPLVSAAQQAVERPVVERSVTAGVPRPQAFSRKSTAGPARGSAQQRPTRDSVRKALPAATVSSAVRARSAELAKKAAATQKRAAALAAEQKRERAAAEAKRKKERAAERERRKQLLGDGRAVLPVAGARVAAGFGATGAWARYHTGIDYSAGQGTTIRAPRAGKVTVAGSGRASGWAGTYVTIEHSDGTTSLYAHMSAVSVDAGDRVDAGQVVGKVGQTGRAFGPHLHFEIYPAGVDAGDVYNAVDPQPWLDDLGL